LDLDSTHGRDDSAAAEGDGASRGYDTEPHSSDAPSLGPGVAGLASNLKGREPDGEGIDQDLETITSNYESFDPDA
jgi:hypothetical protein